MTKIFQACLGTETNTFSPLITGYKTYEQTYLVRGGKHGATPNLFAVPLLTWRRMAMARGWDVVESLCAFAMPAGITLRSVYESFRDEILNDLRQTMPVDAVLFSMHGAMVADGYDDCEGDLLARARAIVGPHVPIGVELDLHCHLTQTMVDNATAIITFKEYPHIDAAERAEELFHIIADAFAGRVKPQMTLLDCNMIGVYHTTREPMNGYVAHMQALEDQDGVLSVSLAHGFPWGDVPDMGARVLVITDNLPAQGATLADDLRQRLWAIRDQLRPNYLTMDAALDRALASDQTPVVLADVSDNAGGGAPSDSTFILRRMIERGITNAAVALLWDVGAAALAMEAGEGAEFDMRLGGKLGPMSGDPLDVRVQVLKLTANATQTGLSHSVAPLGDAVALRANGIDIVVNTHRTQVFNPDAFTNVGIDPTQKRILVVKSMQHFYAGFAPIAAQILYVAAPGALVPDFKTLPYQKANRQILE
jgi:microcystin degradation protein MlrC